MFFKCLEYCINVLSEEKKKQFLKSKYTCIEDLLLLHADTRICQDDLGKGGHELSKATGEKYCK